MNRPARRSMIGSDKLVTAREMLDEAPGLAGAAAALGHISRALEHLESWDEAVAIGAIEAGWSCCGAERAFSAARRPGSTGSPERSRAMPAVVVRRGRRRPAAPGPRWTIVPARWKGRRRTR